jgi:hypothetical protein
MFAYIYGVRFYISAEALFARFILYKDTIYTVYNKRIESTLNISKFQLLRKIIYTTTENLEQWIMKSIYI